MIAPSSEQHFQAAAAESTETDRLLPSALTPASIPIPVPAPAPTPLPIERSSLVLLTAVLCLATFCVALDNTIISTAVPKIVEDFDSIDHVGWYAAIYPLLSCAIQPSYGKIYTFVTDKTVFLASLAIFEVGSGICGVAPSSKILILGRALAGVGSAGIQAGTTLIIAERVPLRKRPTYNGVVGSAFALGSVVGPLLGGAFSDKASWRWCFYINLPVGGLVILFILFFYEGTRNGQVERVSDGLRKRLARFDLAGTLVFMAATVSLLVALTWAGSKYAWDSVRIVALLAGSGTSLVLFVGIEYWMEDSAIIPLRLLHNRSMVAGIWFGLCLGGVFFIVDGVSAVKSAMLFIPFMLSVVGGFMVSGFVTTLIGYYTPFVWASSISMFIGSGLLATVQAHKTSYATWIGFQVLCGAGIGMGEEQGLIMVQRIFPEADVATGIGIILFAQTFGGALFVSVAQAVFLNDIARISETLSRDADPYVTVIRALASLSDTSGKSSDPGSTVVYADAIKACFHVAFILAIVSSVGASMYEWKSLSVDRDGDYGSVSVEETHLGAGTRESGSQPVTNESVIQGQV